MQVLAPLVEPIILFSLLDPALATRPQCGSIMEPTATILFLVAPKVALSTQARTSVSAVPQTARPVLLKAKLDTRALHAIKLSQLIRLELVNAPAKVL